MTTTKATHIDTAVASALVTGLSVAPPSAAAILEARAQIAQGHGAALFAALFAQHRLESGDAAVVAVGEMMQTLERLWTHGADLSGYLMARLYPVASRYKDHDTYNAIELWMDSSSSVALADALVQLAAEGVRRQLRTTYAAWAEQIRRRAGH